MERPNMYVGDLEGKSSFYITLIWLNFYLKFIACCLLWSWSELRNSRHRENDINHNFLSFEIVFIFHSGCNKFFNLHSELEDHVKTTHTTKFYVCDRFACRQIFFDIDALRRHVHEHWEPPDGQVDHQTRGRKNVRGHFEGDAPFFYCKWPGKLTLLRGFIISLIAVQVTDFIC